jgi:AICAR transformylase/IMP cyclohydrolase PurH
MEELTRKVVYGSMLIAVLVCAGGAARADQRSYVWTEEYATPAQGSAEIEFFQTAVTKEARTRSASDWEQRIELEYGVTDHLSASLYEVYRQDADTSSLTYVGYNLELRYRVSEKNVLPVDVLL